MLSYKEMRQWPSEKIQELPEEKALELGFLKSRYQKDRFYTTKIIKQGYVQLYVPKEDPLIKLCATETKYYGLWIPLHRYIYSERIGYILKSWEHIHHKDTNKQNNDFDNLELWIVGHGVGGRLVDILNNLPEDVFFDLVSQTKHQKLLSLKEKK